MAVMDDLTDANFRMSVASSARGCVGGRLERLVSPHPPEAIGLGTMVDFAEFLTLRGCETVHNGGSIASISHVSAHVLAASSANHWTGECQISVPRPGLCISEVSIWDETAGRIALITQTAQISSHERVVLAAGEQATADGSSIELLLPNAPRHGNRLDIPATRRRQIFEAATRVITGKGFERATMREIAREAGLTIPTMYQYVDSKDGILELIFDSYLTKMEDGLRCAVADKATATERLTAAVSATLANLSAYYREVRIMTYDTKSLRPEILEVVLRRMMNYLSIFTEIVAEGVASGEFRPINAELFANLVPMMCQVWVQRHWSVGKFGLPAVERAILELALEGLRNPANRSEAPASA